MRFDSCAQESAADRESSQRTLLKRTPSCQCNITLQETISKYVQGSIAVEFAFRAGLQQTQERYLEGAFQVQFCFLLTCFLLCLGLLTHKRFRMHARSAAQHLFSATRKRLEQHANLAAATQNKARNLARQQCTGTQKQYKWSCSTLEPTLRQP